jgi:hypothetical protein
MEIGAGRGIIITILVTTAVPQIVCVMFHPPMVGLSACAVAAAAAAVRWPSAAALCPARFAAAR